METTFTFRHIDPSEGLKQHALDKLQKLDKYKVQPLHAHVIFTTERFQHVVEITLTAHGVQYVSLEKEKDMYASLDLAMQKIERQLKRHKERIKGHHKQHDLVPNNKD